MNPYTGELIAVRKGEEMPDGFERIARGTAAAREAAMKLRLAMMSATVAASGFGAATASARVNLHRGSPLAVWAKKKRKAKIALESRRRNRK
jgi:hypothetical protein